MRLTVYSDYALRLLIYLGLRQEGLSTIQEVADAYGISKNHLMKVAHQLGLAGYVETLRGRNGGLRLARAPEEISLGAVIRQTEEDFTLVECFAPETNRCAISGACRLKGALAEALEAYLAVLDGYTLADLVAPQRALSKMLGVETAAPRNRSRRSAPP